MSGEVKISTKMSSLRKLRIIDYELCVSEYGLRKKRWHIVFIECRHRSMMKSPQTWLSIRHSMTTTYRLSFLYHLKNFLGDCCCVDKYVNTQRTTKGPRQDYFFSILVCARTYSIDLDCWTACCRVHVAKSPPIWRMAELNEEKYAGMVTWLWWTCCCKLVFLWTPQTTRYLVSTNIEYKTSTLFYIKTIANILYKRSEIIFKFLCSCLCLTWVLTVTTLAPKIY